ncbi:MAG: transposase [Alistipes sp.]|nr:transposase [Bacteroidaceae bacterium]MBR6661782.1 transposase [Alistipes sp.]
MPRGRDKELIKRRDEALCRRYYYWTEKQRLRFDDALKVLSKEEFFISEERILAIIRRKCKELDDIALSIPARIKKPRLTLKQLELFSDEAGESISALRKKV